MYYKKENILLVDRGNVDENLALVPYHEPRLIHNVVLWMVKGLLHVTLIVVLDNSFLSI